MERREGGRLSGGGQCEKRSAGILTTSCAHPVSAVCRAPPRKLLGHVLPIINRPYEEWEADGGRLFNQAWNGLTDEQRASVSEQLLEACTDYAAGK